jgi:hypothetical protein
VPRHRLNQIAAPLYASDPDRLEAHELSSVLTILALGTMMDVSDAPDAARVYRYSNLGKLCLSLDCIFGQTSVSTIEANLLRLIFLLFDRDRTAPMKVFGQLGLIWRLIISMGMRMFCQPILQVRLTLDRSRSCKVEFQCRGVYKTPSSILGVYSL